MNPDALLNDAISLHQQGRLDEAAVLYERILGQFPTHSDSLQLRGLVEIQRSEFAAALRWLERAVASTSDHGPAHANRAAALIALGRYEEAHAAAVRALELMPRSLAANNNLVAALNEQSKFDEALAAADAALAAGIEDAKLHVHRSDSLIAQYRYEEAVEACDRAIEHDPQLAEGHGNRARALAKLNRTDEASASFERVLALIPESPEGHCSHATALLAKKAPREAAEACDRALALRPRFAEALAVRALAFRALKRYGEAIADCDSALELQPDRAEIFAVRASIFKSTNQIERAFADAEMAVALAPNIASVPGERVYFCLRLCEWDGLAQNVADILAAVDAGHRPAEPWLFNVLPSTPAQQRLVAARCFRDAHPQLAETPRTAPPFARKVRIGYFSADFREHPTSHLILGMIEAHDRSRFEVYAFAYGGARTDPIRKRLEQACDHFLDVTDLSGAGIAALARERGLHIAVDLNGYTADGRTEIFAEGAAPIQVNYLGFPGTMGADCIHYIIGDSTVTPPESYAFFSERIVTMPHSYQPNSLIKRGTVSRIPNRHELGLPKTGFVFCCFNSLFKITPDVFDIWMRLLAAVEGSVIWLLGDNATAVKNLKSEARQRGIDPQRLVFAPRSSVNEYLARFPLADLFLDTFPCTAHTTCGDALLMGLPVITREGLTFMSRVAASLLRAAGLHDLITSDAQAYERLALRLAMEPDVLERIRRRVADDVPSSPLFDVPRYTRDLEAAYDKMWARHAQGLAPDHIRLR